MWLLQIFSEKGLSNIIYAMLVVGGLSTVISIVFINPLLKFFPVVAGTYRLIQTASVVVFLMAVYLWGGYSTEMRWRKESQNLEAKAVAAQAGMAEVAAKLDKAIVERDFAVATRGKHTIQRIEKYINGPGTTTETKIDLSPVQRAELERQIAELRSHMERCPVPTLIVKEHNLLIREQNSNRGLKEPAK